MEILKAFLLSENSISLLKYLFKHNQDTAEFICFLQSQIYLSWKQ